MEKLWIRWIQYWITYFKANSSNRSFWPFYRGNTEDVWCKNSEVHVKLRSLTLSYIQQNLCLCSYREWLPLLPFRGSINWGTSFISKPSIYYSMKGGLMISSSICPDNLMEFLEGLGCTILDQFSFLLCQNHSFCAATERSSFSPSDNSRHPDADNLKNGKAFQ